ncbi:MAG: LppM family (lipo)protein [Candidatus Nanopelagicales bacterium]
MRILAPRRLGRGLVIATVGALAVASLSGCLSMTADLNIDSDAKASGTLAIGLQKQAASMLGMTDLDSFSSGITSEGSDAAGSVLSTGDCTPSETDAEYVYTCAFSGQAFTDAADGPWTITKSGDAITFALVNAGTSGLAGGEDAAQMTGGASMGDLTVTVAFPGEITSVTGSMAEQTSDTTATIKGPLADVFEVTIVSKATGAGGGGIAKVLLVVGLILLAIIVIAVVVALVMRGRKPAASAAVVAPAAMAETATEPVATETVVSEPVAEETIGTEPVIDEPVVDEPVVDEPVVDEPKGEEPPPAPWA